MSLIQCHFDYAGSFWYPGLSKFLRERLQVTQNKMVRFVLKLDPKSHVGSEEFKSLGWLPVSKRLDQVILNHIFRIRSGTSPEYMGERFTLASSIHNYSTRFRENGCYLLPKVKRFGKKIKVKSFGKKSFAFTGCTLWNAPPSKIKSVNSLTTFKTEVKSHLLDSVLI